MEQKEQIEYLMEDLRAIRDFFANHGYKKESIYVGEAALGKGFKLQELLADSLASPILHYHVVTEYETGSLVADGGKTFFVGVDILPNVNSSGYGYDIRVRMSPDPKTFYGEMQLTKRHWGLPTLPRDDKPVEKMLADLKRML